ncbi:hypothetical protein RJ641_005973, partial [Dillenia turbinata]
SSMDIITDALRQAFMPRHEYDSLREEDRALVRLQRPLVISAFVVICLAVFISTLISLKIMFPNDPGKRPFCRDLRVSPIPINGSDSDLFPGALYLTDQETVDYFYAVIFVPSSMVFLVSVIYLVAGIAVAYYAPARHGCLKVVENNFCASKGGGVRCLSIINMIFAVVFGLLALFLGSSLLTLGSSCSQALFWCYEIASWGLVILYGATALFLKRKAAVILDEGGFAARNFGLEMLEATPMDVTPDVERRVNEGFRTWMGSSILSSDEEDELDDGYQEVSHLNPTNSSSQRL